MENNQIHFTDSTGADSVLPFSNYNPSKLVLGASQHSCNFTAPGAGKIIYSFGQPIANQTPSAYVSINGRYISADTIANFSKGDVVIGGINGYWMCFIAYAYYT